MIADTIKTLLDADVTLTALLTGGIYTNTTISEIAVNRHTSPSAFQPGNLSFLRPLLIINQRVERPMGGLADSDTSYQSTYQIVELWYYNDRGAGYATLDSAASRVYTLLNGERLTGAFDVRRISHLASRDSAYQNAPIINDEYAIVAYWQEA